MVLSKPPASLGRLDRVPRGGLRRGMIYEATAEGVEHFETWMLGSSQAAACVNELHMKIGCAARANIPRLIDLVYGQKLAWLHAS